MEEDLRREIAELKATLAELQKDYSQFKKLTERRGRAGYELSTSMLNHMDLLEAADADLRDRLLAVEKHCFPAIEAGHTAVRQLIGVPENE